MNRQADVSVLPTVTGARSDRAPRVAAPPVGAVLLSIGILATTLAACASVGAPTWTFAPVPPLTMIFRWRVPSRSGEWPSLFATCSITSETTRRTPVALAEELRP